MKKINFAKAAPLGLLLLGSAGVVSAAPSFSGDVPTDFTESGVFTIADPGGIDVGVPLVFPAGTISGNDIDDIKLFLDTGSDTLYVGFNTYVIAGDVDSDGDGGTTGTELSGLGGVDIPNFGGTEAFALMLDIDEDGVIDVIAGVSGTTDTSGYSVSSFAGSVFTPGFSFGAPLAGNTGSLFASPSASQPDLEFTITNFSTLPTSSGSDAGGAPFQLVAFIGSFSDAGIGEDYLPGVDSFERVCFDSDGDGFSTCDGDCDDTDPNVNPGADELCDGIDNDCNGDIDDTGDADGDGIDDCDDTEECDGVDNDGDGAVDEGQADSDGDGLCDDLDTEECDGVDNDGDGAVDEGQADSDGDGLCDDLDTEECDGVDNDGDGAVDEGQADSDGDGLCDDLDTEECDGVDNDGDGAVDEGQADSDGDGLCDDLDTEECDGVDNDGDGAVDEGQADSDGDGLCDDLDTEECDAVDNDGDGIIDEGQVDSDGDGLCDALDGEICDGADNDGDGLVDEGQSDVDGDGLCDNLDTEDCDGVDNDGDANIDEGLSDVDGDGLCDQLDTEECDGVDNDGDSIIDELLPDIDGDGICNERDSEDCDGADNDGDGDVDEGLSDVDGDGICDGIDTEECDGVDNDGDGAVDEGQPDSDGDGLCDDLDSEDCDGQDNDGDGLTDEDFPDDNGNGVADCLEGGDDEICNDVDDDGDGLVDEDSDNINGSSPLLGSFHDGGAPVYVISTDTSQATPLVTGAGNAALGVSGVTTSAYNPANGLLYLATADSNDSLYTLNTTTGATNLVGAFGGRATNIRGMDFANSASADFGYTPGNLYGVSIDAFPGCRPNCLFEIDASSGAATPLGGVNAGQVQAVSFDPVTGALWAYDAGMKRLLTITANGTTVTEAYMPDSDQQNGTGIDTLFSLAHGCDGQLYGVDMAYGVLLLLDPVEPQAYWLGAYGDVQDDASGQQLQGLDSWADGSGLCACVEEFEFPEIPDPTPAPTPDPSATPEPAPTPAAPGAAPDSCAVDYLVVADWPVSDTERGFHAVVTVTNTGATPIDGWNLEYAFAGDELITSYWQALVAQSGADVLVGNESYNGMLAGGMSVNFGFLGTYTATGVPGPFTLNGVVCD